MKDQLLRDLKELNTEKVTVEQGNEMFRAVGSFMRAYSVSLSIAAITSKVIANACDNEKSKELVIDTLNKVKFAVTDLAIGLVEEHYDEVYDAITPIHEETLNKEE